MYQCAYVFVMKTSPVLQSLLSDLGLSYDPFDSLFVTSSDEPDTFEINVAGYRQEELKVSAKDGYLLIECENEKRGRTVRRLGLRDNPVRLQASYDAGLLSVKVIYKEETAPAVEWSNG